MAPPQHSNSYLMRQVISLQDTCKEKDFKSYQSPLIGKFKDKREVQESKDTSRRGILAQNTYLSK